MVPYTILPLWQKTGGILYGRWLFQKLILGMGNREIYATKEMAGTTSVILRGAAILYVSKQVYHNKKKRERGHKWNNDALPKIESR